MKSLEAVQTTEGHHMEAQCVGIPFLRKKLQ